MSEPEFSPELIKRKNEQRAALKREYLKMVTNPHAGEGHVFDPALQRYLSMKVAKIEHFRETPKSIMLGICFLVIPVVGTVLMFKHRREAKEANFRAGNVAYKDRLFKFI